jgi:hypothetical protein
MKIPPGDWRRERYIEWLCTIHEDRDPRTVKELADELVTTVAALTRLKAEPDFLAAWEHAYRRTVGSPEKAQRVVQRLYETAEDRTDPRQVQAAKAYLEAIDAIKPKKVEVTVNKAAKDLSDEDLYRILAERAELELRERTDA